MKKRLMAALSAMLGAVGCGAATEFAPPIKITADGTAVRVEAPGFACPCWADMDGDGKKDLVVGQFNEGKMRVFKSLGEGKFAAGNWLQAEGKDAEVPGVW